MAAPNYSINYEDQRFKDVETEKQNALDSMNDMYGDMVNQSQEFYDKQIQASKDYADKQSELQQEKTDHLIDQLNQQKEQAHKDYLKEQSGAYVDWQKQSNQYGAQAEQMAANGLANTGFSEFSNVSMWNTYQNRVSTARESFNQIVLNYDNGIKDAQLANNSALADIYYQALQQQLELSLQGFQYKNDLLREQLQQQQSIDDRYYSRWQDVLNQQNQENSLKEQIRQFEAQMEYQKARDKIADQQWQKEYNLQKKSTNASIAAQKAASKISSSSSSGYRIDTDYYHGDIPETTLVALERFGAFNNTVDKNGKTYQPKGVIYNGKVYGAVSKTGIKVSEWTNNSNFKNSSGVNVSGQNVFYTSDGTYWIWNGSKMTYEKIPAPVNSSVLQKLKKLK